MMINANTVSNYSGLMLRMSAFQQNSKLSTTILTGRGHDFFNDATFLLSPLAWPITIHKCRSASTSVDEIKKKTSLNRVSVHDDETSRHVTKTTVQKRYL